MFLLIKAVGFVSKIILKSSECSSVYVNLKNNYFLSPTQENLKRKSLK